MIQTSPAVLKGANVHLIKGADMSQQLELDFYNTEYMIMLQEGVEWSWKHFKTSIPRQRLIESFNCRTVEEVGICPRFDAALQCDMASHCHVMLNLSEDDPDYGKGKLCTVCFHDAITRTGEASWSLEDVV